jgi:RNA polymerase sigma factor (sigma-70 family)
VERHHAELYRYARALLRNTPAAEDAVQDAFERAFAALGKYPKERIETLRLRPWLYRITLNVVRNAWRDSRWEVPVAETPEVTDQHFGAVPVFIFFQRSIVDLTVRREILAYRVLTPPLPTGGQQVSREQEPSRGRFLVAVQVFLSFP